MLVKEDFIVLRHIVLKQLVRSVFFYGVLVAGYSQTEAIGEATLVGDVALMVYRDIRFAHT